MKRTQPNIFEVDLNSIVNKRMRVQRRKRKSEEPRMNAFIRRNEQMQDANHASEKEET